MKSKSFHLKWSSHFPNMEKVFTNLVSSEALADVSIICSGGEVLKSHRFILSSSSDFLHNLFIESSSSQPVVFLPEINPLAMKLLLNFIYTGEIQVEDEALLNAVMETSELLFIKGIHSALEEKQKKSNPVILNVENIGNKRKTRSPRQYISPSPPSQIGSGAPNSEEEPRDLTSRKGQEENSDILKDRHENLNNIMDEDGASYNNDFETQPPSKLLCLDEAGGQAWASNHQIFSSMLPKVEIDPLNISPITRIKQEDSSPMLPLHPPVNLTSEHINNILNTSTVPVCPLCGKDCANFPNLRTHLQTHNNSKPFACDFCDSKFTRASHLSRHRRSHTGEKPFECSICGKLFSRQDKLKVHVDRHRIKEQKEMKARQGALAQSKSQSLQHQAGNWSVNAAFPSQVSPYPSYYETVPKTQNSTLMPSFLG